jgi:hypothetical protein
MEKTKSVLLRMPMKVYTAIAKRAEKNRRSVSAQMIFELECAEIQAEEQSRPEKAR